jgi:hypothetical protein
MAEEDLRACLQDQYDLSPVTLEFLPVGHDYEAEVYRAPSEEGTASLFKVTSRPLYEPRYLQPGSSWLQKDDVHPVVSPIRMEIFLLINKSLNLFERKASNAVRTETVQFRCRASSKQIGNGTTDGRGERKAVRRYTKEHFLAGHSDISEARSFFEYGRERETKAIILTVRSFSKEFEELASRDACFLSLSISFLSLREAKPSLGRGSLDQVGNAHRFIAVFCPKVGNESYFSSKKMTEP